MCYCYTNKLPDMVVLLISDFIEYESCKNILHTPCVHVFFLKLLKHANENITSYYIKFN